MTKLDPVDRSYNRVGVAVGSCSINRLLFAVDLVLRDSSDIGLHHALDRSSGACDQTRMKIRTKIVRCYASPDTQASTC